ncbi:MAG: hypothetical protein HOK61_06025 [Alphaproteobacteria bacterium]|nr:hypothetical protein [Alphaproteobacteria bacterium]
MRTPFRAPVSGVVTPGSVTSSGADKLAGLRQTVRAIERQGAMGCMAGSKTGESAEGAAVLPFGVGVIDAVLPDGGLPSGAVHEVRATAVGDEAAAIGFLCALLARLQRQRSGVVLWCQRRDMPREWGGLYGPGLAAFGVDPTRLVGLRLRRADDVLWAMREGVATAGGVAAVVGETASPDLTAWRRLQLAAEETGVSGFLLRGGEGPPSRVGGMFSRWLVRAAASGPVPELPADLGMAPGFGPGRPRWHVRLDRCRGGAKGGWDLEWCHETGSFEARDCAVVTPVFDGPALPGDTRVAR